MVGAYHRMLHTLWRIVSEIDVFNSISFSSKMNQLILIIDNHLNTFTKEKVHQSC